MSTYAIGDLQGCHAEFEALLERIAFEPRRDRLWLVGDLVNRGPGSLACLRAVKALGDSARVVLGNHDLHLLAAAWAGAPLKRSDTLAPILEADDRDELLDWLRRQPLLVRDDELDAVMTHAGLPPHWSVTQAAEHAAEVEQALRGEAVGDFLAAMYGNSPARWTDELEGIDRLRVIVNTFTRMRFIAADGTLDFAAKEGLDSAPEGFAPWFTYARDDDPRIVFGHWAALQGATPGARVRALALDTGCVWGGALTALDLVSGEYHVEPAHASR
ncbi:symmetrical bis(5'-nucleosyl)-tetraphosphatase [Chromohalobacter israelensis]|uniref:symmetrical bis(5'-nucleosyl)-tetraphosphatase n=1 Tax=Chromohalobacter israelensis TaxID=141390 RepID=UPI00054D9B2E|nr:symmetrical bis(5'-nucleosyl)-tetraphosphatase [Chromohalobacter israelensis]MDF9433274.1 symmetrical bis(5'-nucleosyl)-tetraphosphatase [Chromohalobacter israelensis]